MVECWLCRTPTEAVDVMVRGGLKSKIQRCSSCDFDFFNKDSSTMIANNQLDQTRLKRAGLDIPEVEKDFENGRKQSQSYIERFIDSSDRGRNILEIGCSWGYFLDLLRQLEAKPHGVEINQIRCQYVNEKLGIRCHNKIDAYEEMGTKFKKIFLFYVLEYIADPKPYIKRLTNLLEKNGKLIFITPNLRDALKDIWRNQGFNDFFYDECALTYYSPRAVGELVKVVRETVQSYLIEPEQGYSFVNHLSWYLTNKPRTTGIVGGDRFIFDISEVLSKLAPYQSIGKELSEILMEFDTKYKDCLNKSGFGNRIVATITK